MHMDSHINLQNLRLPFHSRYSVPTVLGTPTSLTVQSSVLCSLRGNITQNIQGVEISRSHEIDLRYAFIHIENKIPIEAINLMMVYLFADIRRLQW